MKSKIKILVRPGLIRNRQVWLLYFLYNEKLISQIKLQFKAQWCPELKCWWIESQELPIGQLKKLQEVSVFKSVYYYKNNRVILNKKKYYSTLKKTKTIRSVYYKTD